MFSKVLIANRGEIAVRIMRTCQRLGIATAIVYSDADADSMAVEMADEAIRIGPAAARDSYLLIDKVVAAAKSVGADAIHPGFGFLSENAKFAEALAKASITFVGPNANAINAMGDKIRSKKLAQEAGVNIVPGHVGEIDDADTAARIGGDIGYPVMIKASAGGGGKGMRIAWNDKELREGFSAARNEARGAFGDERVFIEKFIERPRHIEIQVMGDKHGNVIHLGERECSIQRRNQKVIEEAPSPYLIAKTRRLMTQQAVALSQAVDYDSAGTVEFIADQNQNFFFLEMNTRLQVEHPVTECVTGVDLVELMLRVAAGERLPVSQDKIQTKGWAMEARIYAEDPVRGFVPSIGRLKRWRPPAIDDRAQNKAAYLRLDTGVREGDEVTPHYDPMLAKLVSYGPDRASAVDGLAGALDRFEIAGPTTNVDFLSQILRIEEFRKGDLHTGFIAEYGLEGPQDADVSEDIKALCAVVGAYISAREERRSVITHIPDAAYTRDWLTIVNGEPAPVWLDLTQDGARVRLGAKREQTFKTDWRPGRTVLEAELDGRSVALRVARTNAGLDLTVHGRHVHVIATTPKRAELRLKMPEREDTLGALQVLSPMPGLVTGLTVKAGQEVKVGEPLAIIEAMKMENIIRAERAGVMAEVAIVPGDSVAADQVLMTFADDRPAE